MYKLKTSHSILKRVKCTSTTKLIRHKASRSHLLQKKTSKRKRNLRKVSCIKTCDICNLKKKLPYFY
uniref:Large ribosomal subunit protein bL35c n=1 Tax=Caloglossa monosticha TaxID=76906 RepID=A0A1Z1M573_9FLOR|nr:ribosomal protein L35 [Caloglossa monosticha]ARW61060.1 ribosomal protein L35 [Caloglossa monosticha]